MNKRLQLAFVFAIIAGAALWLSTPAELQQAVAAVELPSDLEAWIARRESAIEDRHGLVDGTEKRISWYGDRARTEYAVVYFHGFSATRQETAPLAAEVAQMLGANLFETRLSGHGLQRNALVAVRAEDWLLDAAEALAIAERLGERVVIIGTSTGATLAAAMLGDPLMNRVDTIVMLSPNFAPRDGNAAWLTRPAGPFLAELLVGETRSWEPYNKQQGLYWSTSYPMAAAVEMMRLVDLANRKLPSSIEQRLLMFYSPDDAVISSDAALAVFEATVAPRKSALQITDPGDPSHHILAGDVLSGTMTGHIARDIVDFIRRPVP